LIIKLIMKSKFTTSLLGIVFISCLVCTNALGQTPSRSDWSTGKAAKWLKAGKWSNGCKIKVHKSADVQEFAYQYHKNKALWDKAFLFLKNTNLDTISPGKYPIDGENAFAVVSEGSTKAFEATKWEAHRKYLDIQYVIKGKEKMGKAPIAKATEIDPFSETKDIGFYTVPEGEATYHVAAPEAFLLFFPKDAHRPGVKIEGSDATKKVVIKIKVD